jgi:transcriptional regulator with XRE-family HTH domain
MRDADEVYGATIAAIRNAGALTQEQIAERLGVTQGAVSQLEHKPDMLLSTLRNYLIAVGAERPRLLVTVDGADIDIAL